jgi:predicted phage terminase large subunit-like protein
VYLPRRAEWLENFRTELLQFPKGRYDDQVDSLSQFLNWLEQRNRNRWWVHPLEL